MVKKDRYKTIKEVLSISWIKIVYVICLLIWIKTYHPDLIIIFLVLNFFSGLSWCFDDRSIKQLVYGLLSMNGFLLFYIFLAKYLGFLGAVTAFIIVVLIISALLIWRQWDFFLESMRTIERMIWGKALDEDRRKRKIRKKN